MKVIVDLGKSTFQWELRLNLSRNSCLFVGFIRYEYFEYALFLFIYSKLIIKPIVWKIKFLLKKFK